MFELFVHSLFCNSLVVQNVSITNCQMKCAWAGAQGARARWAASVDHCGCLAPTQTVKQSRKTVTYSEGQGYGDQYTDIRPANKIVAR